MEAAAAVSALQQDVKSLGGAAANLKKELEAAATAAGDARTAEEAATEALKQAGEEATAALQQAVEEAAAALKRAADDAVAAAQQQRASVPLQGPRWFEPRGYTLDPACLGHEDLYLGVLDSLRPFMKAGITRLDMEACDVPLAANDSTDG